MASKFSSPKPNARGELDIADPVVRVRLHTRRFTLDAEQGVGARQQALEARTHALVERALRAPLLLVEGHRRLHVGRHDRTAR